VAKVFGELRKPDLVSTIRTSACAPFLFLWVLNDLTAGIAMDTVEFTHAKKGRRDYRPFVLLSV
jgi:hypothetical protein